MNIYAYLAFPGTCAEAFNFYKSVLGGELFTMTYGEMPAEEQQDPQFKDRIVHARLTAKGAVVMGGDAPPQFEKQPQGFSVSIQIDDPAEAERIFNGLSAGGAIQMPLMETFWAQRFGMFIDRYGIPWMVNCEKPSMGLS